ncbi:MAG: pyruvate carboxylase [Saprospiraceae bacterium]|nr:pyruvate carboxylase [Saprospiraceae bacterium]
MEVKHNRYKKLLVANRGEIAIRVLRAASELKLRTVAVFTYEDRYSLHRYKADESYQIGHDNEPLKPYLDIEEIIHVAKKHQVDAIHPGYGFLSENVNFVRRCEEEGIIFVGPASEVMQKLGDKVQAKEIAKATQVPVIPDSQLDLSERDKLMEEAKAIGFPLVVKAAGGGGGRGMRIVKTESDLMDAFEEAQGEAKVAFGDSRVFLEKFIEEPKHIEVQILGDRYGNIVHLFERDCSVQRRFQKVVEMAPNITLRQDTRDKIYEYALSIARHVNYSHAGTVEFLVDPQENIYFIEVNPRIQVEHTITEEITGVDLVRSQILISMGYELAHPTIFITKQEDVKLHGHAVQCRITTEDPTNGFKPDYGTLIAYRSASGFGIRLDAGSAYPGSTISPFFDSMLVKVTAWGRTHKGACERLHRALSEFRIRGVKTNIGFLMNLLEDQAFRSGSATVNYISQHPGLLTSPRRRDRGTKLLRYLANVIVNGSPDVKYVDPHRKLARPHVPHEEIEIERPRGTKDLLTELGREDFVKWLQSEKKIHFTDTTFRDAHQSLLATRMRTYDMLKVADGFSRLHGSEVFSMEVWGGATFDVSMRFLHEDPWTRLQQLREAIPNILLQMLLRGSNGVGYKAYPDNLIESFIVKAWESGIDLFRIFDSLNWIPNMQTSIRVVREKTDALAEACICYTGDVSDPSRKKYDLQYYVDLGRKLEDEGAHILAIKDMAGLLKPLAAEKLISALKEVISIPIHLHTHDTSSIQAATYMKAIDAGVDVVDVAISSMSGLTSQPNFNSVVAMLKGHPRENPVNLKSLNQYSDYWEVVRTYYYPFETELRAGTASVYDHEIPGGQYSNLRPQARGLGLEDQFEKIKENYQQANELFGDIVKVTPSSKVVGDMAMFMTSNKMNKEDILLKADKISFPDSVKSLFRGELGQPYEGFPVELQKAVLKGEEPFTSRPNAYLEAIDLEKEFADFKKKYGPYVNYNDFLSAQLYPQVFDEFFNHYEKFGVVRTLPTEAFFFGLKENQEILVEIGEGKNLLIEYINRSQANSEGEVMVYFKLNGQSRVIPVFDTSSKVKRKVRRKAEKVTQIGAPLQGSLSSILVKEGQKIEVNDPLFVIEAMKMESTITAPMAGEILKIYLAPRDMVDQDDLVVEIDPVKELI